MGLQFEKARRTKARVALIGLSGSGFDDQTGEPFGDMVSPVASQKEKA